MFLFLKVCLAASSPSTFHFVLVNSLHRIITNVSLQNFLTSITVGFYIMLCHVLWRVCVFVLFFFFSPTWTGGLRSMQFTATPVSFALCSQTHSTGSSKVPARTLHCAWHRWEHCNTFCLIYFIKHRYRYCKVAESGLSSETNSMW